MNTTILTKIILFIRLHRGALVRLRSERLL
jgi:hypothetical protein